MKSFIRTQVPKLIFYRKLINEFEKKKKILTARKLICEELFI